MTDAKPTPNDRQIGSSDITPPPELVQQWAKDRALLVDDTPLHIYIANRASQWGSDHELEACCEWLEQQRQRSIHTPDLPGTLRAVRRPKLPPLKEQALARLALLEKLVADLESTGLVPFHDKDDTIRRALEQLDD